MRRGSSPAGGGAPGFFAGILAAQRGRGRGGAAWRGGGGGSYARRLVSGVAGDTVFLRSYRSAQAAQEMGEAIWRMDRGIHFALEGEPVTGKLIFENNLQSFEREMAAQREGPPSPG